MIDRFVDRIDRVYRRLQKRRDPLILMYHRVAHAPIDPWGLAVTPEIFDAQMEWLAAHRRPVTLDWLVAELKAGRHPQDAVAVTFDDGYRDVLENGKPSLVRHNIPATVFIVSGSIGDSRGFWWDGLAEIVHGAPHVPRKLDLPFATPEVALACAAGDRTELTVALWSGIRLLPFDQRHAAIDTLASAYGITPPAPPPIMTEAELHQLTDGGLVTLGVHSVTHPSLPSLPDEELHAEIAQCRQALERIMGVPNRRLAYPFGDNDRRTRKMARMLGFDYAVGVLPGTASRWSRRFRLPRIDVKNWQPPEFAERLAWY